MGWGSMFSLPASYITLDEAKKKYGDDPYFLDALKFTREDKWFPKFVVPDKLPGMEYFNGRNKVIVNTGDKFNTEAFNEYVKEREFLEAMDERTISAADERGSVFDKEGAPPGAGADERDYSSYSGVVYDDLIDDDKSIYKESAAQKMIDDFGSDPYFADFIAAGNRATTASRVGKSFLYFPNYNEYRDYVNQRMAEDARAARIEAANPTIDEIAQDGLAEGNFPLNSANADGDVITSLTGAQIEAAFLDPNIELIQDDSGNYIGYRPTQGQTGVADTTISTDLNNDSNIDFTGSGESGTGGAGGTGTLGELGIIDRGGVIWDPDASNQDPDASNQDPVTTGTLDEAVSPGFEIIGNIIYDADGNIIGTTGETAPGIAPVVGGASDTNPIFDEITAEQQAELDQNAEAVALLDSGYGRYNAAIRKMGIVGRQGEEYAPLILDQLRMAEMEAAQPQFAAFGFGQNDMLGGMPQIGVQGVQGNVGGQSALSALSNAGLNQLNVGRQNYNRIALPSVGADGMPISQINNPTIFKASTNV